MHECMRRNALRLLTPYELRVTALEDVNMVPEKRSDPHTKASFYVEKLSYV